MIRNAKALPTALTALLLAGPTLVCAGTLDDAITLAKGVATEKLNVSATDIKFVQSEAQEWSDSSLGCPQKGMQYQQVITTGYEVRLITATHTHTLHVAGDRAVICSPSSGTPRERLVARDAGVIELVQEAREDLALRLGDDVQAIRIAGVTPTNWPDASLGCPEKGMSYAQVVTPGYIIELESDGRPVTYHSDGQRVIYCAQ